MTDPAGVWDYCHECDLPYLEDTCHDHIASKPVRRPDAELNPEGTTP